MAAETSLVDVAVLEKVSAAKTKGRGWLIDAAQDNDGKISVEVQETVPPVDEYIPHAHGRQHEFDDLESLILFAERYGDKTKSLVLVSDDRAVVVLDEQIERGDREKGSLFFGQTDEFVAWNGVVGKKLGHKALLQHLIFHLHTMDDATLLASMRKATVHATIDNESDIQETNKTLGVRVHTKGGEELAEFPKEIKVKVPVLREDVLDETAWMSATMRLQIDLPDRPEDAVGFTLVCSEWSMLVRKRTQTIVEELRAGLDGWTVLRGLHATFERRIGRSARPDQSED
ncbi:MAG: hypothetical protein AAF593_01270 [Planctomycetota bacterium]